MKLNHTHNQVYDPDVTPRLRVTGWIISLLVHVSIGMALLVYSLSASHPIDKKKKPPQAIIQKQPEPLQIEPIQIPPLEQSRQQDVQIQNITLPTDLDLISPIDEFSNAITVTDDGQSPLTSANSFTIPPSRPVAEFCGTAGQGLQICFVVDCSGSMVIAFDYIKDRLKKSISQLKPTQYFNIIFFAGGEPIEMNPGQLIRAGGSQRQKAIQFVESTNLTQVSDTTAAWKGIIQALQSALNAQTYHHKQTQLIFLLTDGEYDHEKVETALNRIQSIRDNPAVISVVACGNRDNEAFLKHLSKKYKGGYRFISDEEMVQRKIDLSEDN